MTIAGASFRRQVKSRLPAVAAILMAVLVLAVFVRGFVVANFWSFGGQRTTETPAGPRVTIWIDTHIEYFGFLGINLYGRSRGPSSLRLEFNVARNSCHAVDMRDLTLRYSDGQIKSVIEPDRHLQRPFEDYQYVNWSGDGLVTNRASKLVFTFTNVVDRMIAVTVTCNGDFIKEDGSMTAFGVTEEFRPKKEIGISAGWHTASP